MEKIVRRVVFPNETVKQLTGLDVDCIGWVTLFGCGEYTVGWEAYETKWEYSPKYNEIRHRGIGDDCIWTEWESAE